jgi:dipeptidyl aminopeptidase/acylaminoacyl peptidase
MKQMPNSYLLLICLVFSVNIYSQTKKPKDIWEEKLGAEKKIHVLQAVEDWDSSFMVNLDPIIYVNDTNQPFMLLNDSNKLLFYIQEKHTPVPTKSVDVYSYTDVKLQDEQLRDVDIPRKYAVVFDFSSSRLIRLENEGEKLVAQYSTYVYDIQINGQYVLVYDFGTDIFTYESSGVINETYSVKQYTWNKALDCNVYLVSLKDSSKKTVKKNAVATMDKFPFFRLSPDSHYVLSYEDHNYYSYAIATGKSSCLTKHISNYFSPNRDFIDYYYPQDNMTGWKDESKVLVTDVNSDVWELDLTDQKKPVKQLRQSTQSSTGSYVSFEKKEGTIATEKVKWKTFDGKTGSGVLAKPKDFDPKKKYPILFIYYENSVVKYNSNMTYGSGDFVDYGYLVFSPNIDYSIGETGNSVLNYVVSAAEYLKKMPYVDASKMGLRGASFGGYETNYLVTHTNQCLVTPILFQILEHRIFGSDLMGWKVMIKIV